MVIFGTLLNHQKFKNMKNLFILFAFLLFGLAFVSVERQPEETKIVKSVDLKIDDTVLLNVTPVIKLNDQAVAVESFHAVHKSKMSASNDPKVNLMVPRPVDSRSCGGMPG